MLGGALGIDVKEIQATYKLAQLSSDYFAEMCPVYDGLEVWVEACLARAVLGLNMLRFNNDDRGFDICIEFGQKALETNALRLELTILAHRIISDAYLVRMDRTYDEKAYDGTMMQLIGAEGVVRHGRIALAKMDDDYRNSRDEVKLMCFFTQSNMVGAALIKIGVERRQTEKLSEARVILEKYLAVAMGLDRKEEIVISSCGLATALMNIFDTEAQSNTTGIADLGPYKVAQALLEDSYKICDKYEIDEVYCVQVDKLLAKARIVLNLFEPLRKNESTMN